MKIDKCPHCGSDEGYYRKTQIRGNANTYYTFNHEYADEGENTAIHDSLIYSEGKRTYCANCGKVIKFSGGEI